MTDEAESGRVDGAIQTLKLRLSRSRLAVTVAAGEFTDDVADEIFGVPEEHQRAVEIVERVINTGEAGGHAALDDHYGARLVHIENRHAVDGAARIRASGGIGDVVGTDHESHIGLRKVTIDKVHLQELVVRNVGFGQQHIHVAGHAAGDGMNAEGDLHAAFGQGIVKFAHFVLSLRDGHAVAGNDNHFAGRGENSGSFFWRRAFYRTRFFRSRRTGLNLS